MSWSAGLVAALLAGSVLYLALAAFVWANREVAGSRPLTVMLLAVMVWAICYALELSSTEVATARWWSGLKYVGIVALPPALWSFVLDYTGRGPLKRSVLALMLIEPAIVLGLLAVPATSNLIHSYDGRLNHVFRSPAPAAGPLFWLQAVYTYALMLGAVTNLLLQLARIARPYRRQGAVLMGASILPFLGNVLWNLQSLGSGAVDPTPFLFVITAVVLVWGFFRLRLLDLLPVARGVVVEQMADGMLVVDVYGRVVDANPAGAALVGLPRPAIVGRRIGDLLPTLAGLLDTPRPGPVVGAQTEVAATGQSPDGRRSLAVSVSAVNDPAGRQTAHLLVLRDVTELREAERRLHELLGEQTRLSETLTTSLRPASLPELPGMLLAARSVPAGRGGVSGDFYDVHSAGRGRSAFVLGDVSGKGVQAAVVTSMARYTVRTLSAQGWTPRQVLEQLNQALLAPDDEERFCTVVYGQLWPDRGPRGDDGVRLVLALGGHPPPLLRRRDRSVGPIGLPGTALGLLPAIEVHEVSVHLTSGDLLLAYTDGVTEARVGQEQFGEGRLVEVLAGQQGSVQEVADGVLAAVETFAPDRDDVALLVLAVP